MTEQLEIIKLAQAGSEEALHTLVDRFYTPALRVAQNILGDPQDAEDTVQEVWIDVLRSWEHFAIRNGSTAGCTGLCGILPCANDRNARRGLRTLPLEELLLRMLKARLIRNG